MPPPENLWVSFNALDGAMLYFSCISGVFEWFWAVEFGIQIPDLANMDVGCTHCLAIS